MKIVKEIKDVLNGKTKKIDMWYYIQGMWRYKVYYSSKLRGVAMRKHIKEQIDYRIKIMNPTCYFKGTCIMCGCMTTALQMCDKVCEGDCYPVMMNKKQWLKFKIENNV